MGLTDRDNANRSGISGTGARGPSPVRGITIGIVVGTLGTALGFTLVRHSGDLPQRPVAKTIAPNQGPEEPQQQGAPPQPIPPSSSPAEVAAAAADPPLEQPAEEQPPAQPAAVPPPEQPPLEQPPLVTSDLPLEAPPALAIDIPPPEPLNEEQPPPPSDGTVWVGGYWGWTGDWTWVRGRWLSPPWPGCSVTPAYYGSREGAVIYIRPYCLPPGAPIPRPPQAVSMPPIVHHVPHPPGQTAVVQVPAPPPRQPVDTLRPKAEQDPWQRAEQEQQQARLRTEREAQIRAAREAQEAQRRAQLLEEAQRQQEQRAEAERRREAEHQPAETEHRTAPPGIHAPPPHHPPSRPPGKP